MKATILLVLAGLALTNAQYGAEVGPINNGKIAQDVNTAVQSGANNTATKIAVDNSQIAQAENQLPAYAPVATSAPSYSPPEYVPPYNPAPVSAPSNETAPVSTPSSNPVPVYEPVPLYAPEVPTYAPAYASYSEGPINWSQSKTQVNTGGQSALNKGSAYSSNENTGRNINAKTTVESNEVAQAEEGLAPQY